MFSLLPRTRTTAKLLPSIQARTITQPSPRQVFSAPERPAAPSTPAIPVTPNTPTSAVAGSSTVTSPPKDVHLSQPHITPLGTNARAQPRSAKKSALEKLDEEYARRLDEHEGGIFGFQWKRSTDELVGELKWLEQEVRATEKQINVQRR